MKYTVEVDDNFHYMDEEERYTLGVYDSAEEAVAAAKRVVDGFLSEGVNPGATARELFYSFTMFGDTPHIIPTIKGFDAWEYARQRCIELRGDT